MRDWGCFQQRKREVEAMRGAGVVQATRNSWVRRMSATEVWFEFCIYMYLHLRMHIYIYTYTHTCACTYTYLYIYTRTHVLKRAYIHVLTHTCVYIYIYILIYIYICIYIYIQQQKYTQPHVQTNIRKYIHMGWLRSVESIKL